MFQRYNAKEEGIISTKYRAIKIETAQDSDFVYFRK